MKYGIIITQNQELTEALSRKKFKISHLKERLSETTRSTTPSITTPDSLLLEGQAPRERPLAPKTTSFLLMLKHFGLQPFNFYPHFKGEQELRQDADYIADLKGSHSHEDFFQMKPQHLAFIQTLGEFYKFEQAQRLRTEEQSFKMIEAL